MSGPIDVRGLVTDVRVIGHDGITANVNEDRELLTRDQDVISTIEGFSASNYRRVTIVDENNDYATFIDASGRLYVSSPTPTPPPTGISVKEGGQVTVTKLGGYSDVTYSITNGTTLTLQRFSAGAYIPKQTTAPVQIKVELWEDVYGDGLSMWLIDAIYLQGESNAQFDEGDSFFGDGSRSIRMRTTNQANEDSEVFCQFIGYEEGL